MVDSSPKQEDRSDENLMLDIQRGSVDAFEELYHRYDRLVHLIGLRTFGESLDADALVVTVFLELWKHPQKYHPDRGSARTYLMLLSRSRAKDFARSVARRRGARLEALQDLHGQVSARQQLQDPATRIADDDLRASVRESMSRLPEEARCVLELAFFGGLTHQEVSQKLRLPLGTVKSRIRRGLKLFRECWVASQPDQDES